MGMPIKHLFSQPPPIVSFPLCLIYHVTSLCKVLLLGCRGRGYRAQFSFPSGSQWMFLEGFTRKASNIPTALSLLNKSKMGPPSKRYHEAESPPDYVAPLCKCGERWPIGADELDKGPYPGHTVLLALSLAIRARKDLGSPYPSSWAPLLLFLAHGTKDHNNRLRENNSKKNFPSLLFPILEETWRIQVYKHTSVKYPTTLIKWILFEL